jgi:hypothetical protein
VAIEGLHIGDLVTTAHGQVRPIKWIGRRSYTGRFLAANPNLQPIRFRAGSLGEGVPRRDLIVSPNHAMFLDGVLVPAKCLLNGVTVLMADAWQRVEYFHLELDSHDVLLAEGTPSESFVDDNSRGLFHNAHEHAAMFPDQWREPAVYCADHVEDGERLDLIKRAIDLRAGLILPALGEPLPGHVDGREGNTLRGWVQNTSRPDAPVCLLQRRIDHVAG